MPTGPEKARQLFNFKGHDNAIVGFAERFNSPAVLAYDTPMIMRNLLIQGMSMDEAENYFEKNMLNVCLSDDGMPIFVTPTPLAELQNNDRSSRN